MTKLAAGWAALYGTLALSWTFTGRGYPFGPGDARNTASPLRALDAAVGAPLFAAVLLTAAVALLAMTGAERPHPAVRAGLLGYLGLVVAALLFVEVDVRALTVAGYLPMMIVGLPFGWPPIDYGQVFTWALANQVFAIIGGLLIARAAVRWNRRTRDACEVCGRQDHPRHWTDPDPARRWGRIAAWVAAVIPALYAAVRICWAIGIPFGIPREFLDSMHRTGLVWAGLGLASFALVGTLLTTGLTLRWGERMFGRPVPIRLATIPAGLVAIVVFSASISLFTADGSAKLFTGEDRMATLPMTLWPLWGIALGAAAWAYHLRRRPGCPACGRGPGERAGAGHDQPAVAGPV